MAQVVSQDWLNNQKRTLANEAFIEVSFGIADPDALADASSEDNGSIYIANTAQIVSEVGKNIVPYLTLEQNLWLLNGERLSIPDSDYGDNGYIGNALSKVDCGFDELPTVVINFSQTHINVIPGLTITWGSAYGEYPTSFIVGAYDSENTLVAEIQVNDNKSVTSVIHLDINNYNRIVIRVLKWCLPKRRARIEEVFVGLNIIYGKSELFKFTHTQKSDPASLSLPKAEIQFSIDNSDNAYNPNNPVGLSKYLMERQEIQARYGYKLDNGSVEWIKGGIFYLSEWDAPQNGLEADFTARDLLEFMSQTYIEGVYTSAGVSLYTLAERILLKADLPLNKDGSVKWVIDDSLQSITTVAPLPICTLAECLQLIANAACCVLYQDRSGILHIEPIGIEPTDYGVTLFNSYTRSTITLAKPLKQIEVVVHKFLAGETGSELFNGFVTLSGTEDVVLTYSEPATNIVATVTGGTLNSAEYFTNACRLNITASGDVTILLTGDVLKTSEAGVIINNEVNGEVRSMTNELITDETRAAVVGTWLKDYLKHRMTLKSSWRADPRLDVLDSVANQNDYSTNLVRMTDIQYTFGGAFRGDGEGRVVGVVD
jgi:hypothetical protein